MLRNRKQLAPRICITQHGGFRSGLHSQAQSSKKGSRTSRNSRARAGGGDTLGDVMRTGPGTSEEWKIPPRVRGSLISHI